jgi:hypothetical protein
MCDERFSFINENEKSKMENIKKNLKRKLKRN